MSHCHPGHPGSMFSVTEAVFQLRGACGPRQVKDANIAFGSCAGGHYVHALLHDSWEGGWMMTTAIAKALPVPDRRNATVLGRLSES